MTEKQTINNVVCYFFDRQLVLDHNSILNLLYDEMRILELNTFAEEQLELVVNSVMSDYEFELQLNEIEPNDIAFKYWDARMNVLKLYHDIEQIVIESKPNSKNSLFVSVSQLMPVLCDFLYKTIIKKMYEYVTKSELETPIEFNN